MPRTLGFLALMLSISIALNLAGCPPSTPDTDEPSTPDTDKPSIPETHPTQAILDMEVDVFNRINKERVAGGLSALVMDETMRAVARGHSEDMIARGFFDHVNPDGLDPFERLDAACVDFVSAGENIAWNTFPNPAEEAVRGWMASPHHHDNIMRAQYNRTGIGVATDGNGAYYFTQDFIGTEAKSGEDPVFDYSEPLAITEQAQ